MDLNDALIKVMKDWSNDRKKLIEEFLEDLSYFCTCYTCCIQANIDTVKWKEKLEEKE